MRLALLADLHANREALEAVLGHAATQQVDRYAFLGDFVGYGADPGWVVDEVRGRVRDGAIAVQGNHDAAVVRGALPSMRPAARKVVEWTRARLDAAQLEFLQQLPLVRDSGELLFVHANAYNPAGWDYVMGRGDADRSMRATPARITFCGHMHEPRLYHVSAVGKGGEFTPVSGQDIPLLAPRHWLVIAGSVGQPRDGDPAACYGVYDDSRSAITCWRVPYDVQKASAKVREAGLPADLADRLLDGR